MKKYFLGLLLFVFSFSFTVNAQDEIKTVAGLFDSDSILQITLYGNMNDLLRDRQNNPQYHPLIISYTNENGKIVSITAKAKTRGHFRKLPENCSYPPLLLHFSNNDSLKQSIFKDQQKLKLVMPCTSYELVVREWLVYKLYNLITPKSFKARLVNVTLSDTKTKKDTRSFYGVLLEEENQMAERNNEISLAKKLRPEQIDENNFLAMAMFEYMIGNTDWSIQYLQNIKLLAVDSLSVPSAVPYDFDHAGIVDAPYAKPAEELEMRSVRERRYRGYCMKDLNKFDSVIVLYNALKPAFYKLYLNCSLLNEKYVKATIKYLDDFYATINNASAFKKEFSYPCDKNGTGNVVIKGLKED